MGEIQKKRGSGGKPWKFWILFVAVPIIVVVGSSMAAFMYVKRTCPSQIFI